MSSQEQGRGLLVEAGEKDDLEDPDFPGYPKDEVVSRPAESLPEGIYGMGIAVIIRDSYSVAKNAQTCGAIVLRTSRLVLSCLIVCCLIYMQLYLVNQTKRLITPTPIKHIRELYGKYEHVMYTDASGVAHTTKTVNGFDRGIPGYFNADNFDMLSSEEKNLACRIPLSQPRFLFVILLIWSFTCAFDLRNAIALQLRLIVGVPTITNMADALRLDDEQNLQIEGLTIPVKFTAGVIVLTPRITLVVYLWWIGCRWLTATVGFADLLLNAVALEFILALRELLYSAVIPMRLQRVSTRLQLPHLMRKEPPTFCIFYGMFLSAVAAIICVYLYMYHFQAVLPEYKWDVHAVCETFLKHELEM